MTRKFVQCTDCEAWIIVDTAEFADSDFDPPSPVICWPCLMIVERNRYVDGDY